MREIKGNHKPDGSIAITYTYTINPDQLANRKTALERQAEGMQNDLTVITNRRDEILAEIAAIEQILSDERK